MFPSFVVFILKCLLRLLHVIMFFFLDVKKLASGIVKQWMSLVRNQSGISGIETDSYCL